MRRGMMALAIALAALGHAAETDCLAAHAWQTAREQDATRLRSDVLGWYACAGDACPLTRRKSESAVCRHYGAAAREIVSPVAQWTDDECGSRIVLALRNIEKLAREALVAWDAPCRVAIDPTDLTGSRAQ